MESELNLLSIHLRAFAHVLRYSDYIHSVTGDCDFPTALIDIVSDYLYFRSEHIQHILDEEKQERSNPVYSSSDFEFFRREFAESQKRFLDYMKQSDQKKECE